MTGPNNRSSTLALESGHSKELSGTIRTDNHSSNEQKNRDHPLPQIQENDQERNASIPNEKAYLEKIKKDNTPKYSSLSNNPIFMGIK